MTRRRQRGSAMVEFALAGIASIFLIISTFHLAVGMWNYHVLANAVHETTRYVAVKGVNCTKPGNSCSVSVGTIAAKFKEYAIGIPTDQVIFTLSPQVTAATTCNPLNTCFATGTTWPPSTNSDNAIGKRITVSATYRFRSPMAFFWPSQGAVQVGEIWFPASSTQTILF